jgi:hypothetical protein
MVIRAGPLYVRWNRLRQQLSLLMPSVPTTFNPFFIRWNLPRFFKSWNLPRPAPRTFSTFKLSAKPFQSFSPRANDVSGAMLQTTAPRTFNAATWSNVRYLVHSLEPTAPSAFNHFFRLYFCPTSLLSILSIFSAAFLPPSSCLHYPSTSLQQTRSLEE